MSFASFHCICIVKPHRSSKNANCFFEQVHWFASTSQDFGLCSIRVTQLLINCRFNWIDGIDSWWEKSSILTFLLHYQQTRNPLLSSRNIRMTGDCALFHQLLCHWEMAKLEENMSKWKAVRTEPNNSWQSPMHVPQWGLCAWPHLSQWSPGKERETGHSSLPCKTICTKLFFFLSLFAQWHPVSPSFVPEWHSTGASRIQMC